MGTRLGRPYPKALTPLTDGRSIMRQQLDHLRAVFGDAAYVSIVVGFKMDLIMEAAASDAAFIYNEIYDQTNTSKSLLKGLLLAPPGAVLWLNGDVVFERELLRDVENHIARGVSFVAVNTDEVGDEEVKYTLDGRGYIKELSKRSRSGLGEAVGINFVSEIDRPILIDHLAACQDDDYFERALETAIEHAGMLVEPVDISRFGCVEVDCEPDLIRASNLR